MPLVVVLIAAMLAAALVVSVAIVSEMLTIDRSTTARQREAGDAPEPSPAEEPVADRWLVDHLGRVRGVRHVVRLFDRFVWGGAMAGLGLAAVVLGSAAVGWLLSTVDRDAGFAEFDDEAAEWGSSHATDASTTALRWLTHLGGSTLLIPAMAVVGLVIAYRHRRLGHARWAALGFLVTVGVGIVIVNNSLKWLVDRDRPTVTHLASAGGSSFPSGHSAAAAACWAGLTLVGSRRLRRGLRRCAAAAAAAIAAAVAASRVLLGVHWLTDVIAGVVVGWVWFFVVALVFGGRLLRFGAPAEQIAERAEPGPSPAARPDVEADREPGGGTPMPSGPRRTSA